LLQATIGLDNAYSDSLKHGFLTQQGGGLTFRDPATGKTPTEIDDVLKQSKGLIGEASARRARVALLFGPVSAPDRAATLALIGLEGSHRALDAFPDPDLEAYSSELARAREHLGQFNKWALGDIQGKPWFTRSRLAAWIRRRWRKLRSAPVAPK
jgi:hypothetical protein